MNEAARRAQRVEALCAASLRALAAAPDLQWRGGRLRRGEEIVRMDAPPLSPSMETDDFGSFRGASDGMALRVSLSEAALHAGLAPTDPVAARLFDLLEQYRCESLVAERWPGVAVNLRHRHAQWSLAFHREGLTDTVQGLLIYTLAQVCRARVTAEPCPPETEDLMESTRIALAPRIGAALAGLRRERGDQVAYASHALEIARIGAQMLSESDAADAGRPLPALAREQRERLARWLQPAGGEGDGVPVAERSGDGGESNAAAYCVFTTAYDREVRPGRDLRESLRREYRTRLDALVEARAIDVPRLARELRALLASPERDGWEHAQEQGRIDARRLAGIVASPTERRVFRTEREEPSPDCAVAILVDCSGSMKQHVEAVALLVDVLSRALDIAEIDNEVLGFTTGAWNGGRARADWLSAGRPALPGRLNEAHHLIFKDADTAWRRARPDIAALLRVESYREGIDGEAVAWACSRLRTRPARRRILLAISDGCPRDTATAMANGEGYLEGHLAEVVTRESANGSIDIRALGVGLDLRTLYPYGTVLDLAAPHAREVFRDVLRLLATH